MQMEAPELTDLSKETEATKSIYGIDEKHTDDFGKQCLLARRMVERGVRFVSVNYSDESANPRWDQHGNMPKHADHARATDKPVAGLLQDLKARGLLEDTLVWWGGEFGRTPFRRIKMDAIIIQEVLQSFLLVEELNPEYLMVRQMNLARACS